MSETPLYFQNGLYNLFGVLYEPEGQANGTGFVFCAPFAEEMLWTQRVFVNFARELAHQGYYVLRFDIMGHGDSDGDFEDVTVDTWLSDIRCALKTLEEKKPFIECFGLLGLRLGGTLAAIIAEEIRNVKSLILWEPVIEGSKYMKEVFLSNLTTQTAMFKEIRFTRDDLVKMMKEGKTVNVEGYEITYDFYQQVSALNLLDSTRRFVGNCLIVQIGKREQNLKKNLEKLKNLYPNGDLIFSLEEPFWKEIKLFYSRAENLFQNTIKWLEGNE